MLEFFNKSVFNIDRWWVFVCLLVFLIVIIIIARFHKHKFTFNVLTITKNYYTKFQSVLLIISNYCIFLVLIIFILLSSGISKMSTQSLPQSKENYILIALDISPSMSAEDIDNQSRFKAALESIDFLLRLTHNFKIGVLVFSNTISMLVPFTDNYQYIKDSLNKINLGSLGDETAIADALLFSYNMLQTIENDRKLVLFFTDGNQNTGALTLNDLSEVFNVSKPVIVLLHLGSNISAPFLYKDYTTQRIISGILSPVKANILKPFANNAGIEYLSISDQNQLNAFMYQLNSKLVVPTKILTKKLYSNYNDELVYLALGFFLMFLFIRVVLLGVIW